MVKLLRCLLLFCAAASAQAAPDLLLEAELEPPQVHVLSQAVYRLRFLHAVDVNGLEIAGPSAPTADFRAIGKRVGEAVRDGRRYRVHEQSYAVFPFASGALQLSGAHASGRVPSAAPGGRQAVRIEAPPRTLDVLPAAFDDGWLPAASLTLSETWAPAFGNAQRRTIRIEAAGIAAAHLPAVAMEIPGVTVQAAAPLLSDRFDGDTNVGVREQSFLLVPPEGKATAAPELQMHWWDAGAGSIAIARLPAHRLSSDAKTEMPAAPLSMRVPMIVAALAMSLFLLWRRRAAWRLHCACRRADLRAVRDGLLAWSAGMWPHSRPLTLGALAERLADPALRTALNELERALYGPPGKTWNPAALLALVRRVQHVQRSVMMNRLHPLAPERSS